MIGIILNICAYTAMAIGAYFALDISVKKGSRITKFINYGLLFWFSFMVMFFIKDFDNLINSPINHKLNFFETTTNALLGAWLISFRFYSKEDETD